MRIDLDQTEWIKHLKVAVGARQMMKFNPDPTAVEEPEERVNKQTGEAEHRYEVTCSWLDEHAPFPQPTHINVRIWSRTPIAVPNGVSPVWFGGLAANIQERNSGDGKGYTASYSADQVTFEGPPSTKNSVKTASAPAPSRAGCSRERRKEELTRNAVGGLRPSEPDGSRRRRDLAGCRSRTPVPVVRPPAPTAPKPVAQHMLRHLAAGHPLIEMAHQAIQVEAVGPCSAPSDQDTTRLRWRDRFKR